MAKLSVIDLSGASVGEVDVSDDVFGADVREHLLWEAVRVQRAAKRNSIAHTKTRAEVNYTKAKVVRQKGTGGARHGSRRANVFKGGGVVHGPRTHSHEIGMNKKAMAGALRSALSLRARDGDLLVIKEFGGDEVKTKVLAEALTKLEAPKALLVDDAANRWLQLSSRNLADAEFLADAGINVYDILRFPKLLISQSSLEKIEGRLLGRGAEEDAA